MMDDLNDLFAAAGRQRVPPSDALMARVLDDAARLQPRAVAVAVPVVEAGAGFWAGLAALFGGGGVLAGVGSAAVAGLFFGFVQPVGLTSLTDAFGTVQTGETLELMPGVEALLSEE
jgi:hypothetical protein